MNQEDAKHCPHPTPEDETYQCADCGLRGCFECVSLTSAALVTEATGKLQDATGLNWKYRCRSCVVVISSSSGSEGETG